MTSLKKLTNEEYSFLNLLETMESKDIKSMCLVSRDFKSICDNYLNSIYKKLLKRDFKIDVPNNRIFQILYDMVNGLYKEETGNVYIVSFLYDKVDSEQLYNNDNIDNIIQVIKFTKNPNIEDVNKLTPLMLATNLNNIKVFNKILEYNPNINKRDINNFSILSHAIDWKTKNNSGSNTLFNKIVDMGVKITQTDIEDCIMNLDLRDFKIIVNKYKKEIKDLNVLYFSLELCNNINVLKYIINEFYNQYDKNEDIMTFILKNDMLGIDLSREVFIQILSLNKIDIKEYVLKKIYEYSKDPNEELLIAYLVILKDKINIDDIISYLMKNTSENIIDVVLKTYKINFNKRDEENKSIFHLFLNTNLSFNLIKEQDEIDYNDLIKELVYIPNNIKNKKSYINKNNKEYITLLKNKLDILKDMENIKNTYLLDIFNRLTIVLLIASMLLDINKDHEKTSRIIKGYINNKFITDKIDIKYWLSIF